VVSNSILCWAILGGINFRSMHVQANTSLNSFRTSINCFVITNYSVVFIFTYCTFSLVLKLTLVGCSFLMTIKPTMVRSCIHSLTSVSSMIISPTFGWKKVSNRCCLILLGGIVKLTSKTHIDSIGCFGTNYTILRFAMQIALKLDSTWVGSIIFPIENRSNYVANITSSSSSHILKWKS
jgi:hypothetical protein